jgi:hypothetical protein
MYWSINGKGTQDPATYIPEQNNLASKQAYSRCALRPCGLKSEKGLARGGGVTDGLAQNANLDLLSPAVIARGGQVGLRNTMNREHASSNGHLHPARAKYEGRYAEASNYRALTAIKACYISQGSSGRDVAGYVIWARSESLANLVFPKNSNIVLISYNFVNDW